MATFAVIDAEGLVTNVIVAETLSDAEAATGCRCVEYTDEFPAGIGWTFDSKTSQFIITSPYPSWVFNRDTWTWEAPIPMPSDPGEWVWDEATLSWLN